MGKNNKNKKKDNPAKDCQDPDALKVIQASSLTFALIKGLGKPSIHEDRFAFGDRILLAGYRVERTRNLLLKS